MTAPLELRASITFQGKDPEEMFEFYFRQHWMRMVWPFVKLCVWNLLIFLIAFVVFNTPAIQNDIARRALLVFLTMFFLLSQWEFLSRFYRHFLYVIIVTDRKVHRIKKTLLTHDEHQSIDLWVLQDINKLQRGILQNILGFGTVTLEAQDSMLRIHFTPNITQRYEEILKLRERARGLARKNGP